MDVRIKREPRGTVYDNNEPAEFSGVIDNVEASFGFLLRDGHQDKIFLHKYHSNEYWESLTRHRRVVFNLAFNYRGAIAINVKPETSNNDF